MASSSLDPVGFGSCYFNTAALDMEKSGPLETYRPRQPEETTSEVRREEKPHQNEYDSDGGLEFSRLTVVETGRPEVTRVVLAMVGEDFLSKAADPIRDLERREHDRLYTARPRAGMLLDSSSLLLKEGEDFTTRGHTSRRQGQGRT
jgi:hypothetical protein